MNFITKIKGALLIAKILFGTVMVLLLCMLLIPMVFKDLISDNIKTISQNYLTSELKFAEAHVSFFDEFPALTLTLDQPSLLGSDPFSDSEIVRAETLSLSIDILELLFTRKVKITGIYLINSKVGIMLDREGRPNYNIYRLQTELDSLSNETENSKPVEIDKISILDADIVFTDHMRGIEIGTQGFDYEGKIRVGDEDIDWGSRFEIERADVSFENISYLENKKFKANIDVLYKSKSLSIVFGENDLSVNDLDLSFDGYIDFEPRGYSYEILISTQNSKLSDVISALPPDYVSWKENVSLQGNVNAKLNLLKYRDSMFNGSESPDQIEINLQLDNGEVMHKDVKVPLKEIFLKLHGTNSSDGFDIAMDTLSFEVGDEISKGKFFIKGHLDSLDINTQLNSKIDLNQLNESLQLPGISFGGELNTHIVSSGLYQPKKSKFPTSNGHLKLKNAFVQTSFPKPIKNIEIDASIKNRDGTFSGTSLKFGEMSFNFEGNPFNISASLNNFENPDCFIQAKGSLDLGRLNQVFPIPYVSTKGFVRVDALLKGHMATNKNGEGRYMDFDEHYGNFFLEGITINSEYLTKPLQIISGDFTLKVDRLEFSKFLLKYGSNYSYINGYFKNYLPYMMVPEGILQGEFELTSKLINLAEFIPTKNTLKNKTDGKLPLSNRDTVYIQEDIASVLQVPPLIDFRLNLAVDTLRYFNLEVNDLSGNLTIADSGLILKNGKSSMVGGTAAIVGYYRPVRNDEALFSLDLNATNLDVSRAYKELALFQELVPAAESASGIIGIDYDISGALNQQMLPILPSLEGKGRLMVRDVQLSDYKLFGTVSKQTTFDALKDPKLEEIEIKSSIQNNIMDIERFKFRVKPFRLRMQGQTSLSGDLNLRLRVGLPPFGIIGIPIKITGNSDDMQIKLGKRSKELQEFDFVLDEFSEEELLKFTMLKDSISDEMSIDQIQALEKRLDSITSAAFQKQKDTLMPKPSSADSLMQIKKQDSVQSSKHKND